jgi:hypothetical protein
MMKPATAGAGAMMMTMKTASTRDPLAIDQCAAGNPAGLSDADAQALRAGSGSAGNLQWLYPYDHTVFPRGMLAPTLMWMGAQASAVYVHIKSMIFEYSGCLKPSADGQLTLPQDVWDQAGTHTFGATDVYTIELSVLSGGSVIGPITEHITIAQATIKGSIYYNSYNSMLGKTSAMPAGGFGGGAPMGGLVLRIPAGGKAEVFGETGCNGCHSVSADGSRLISQFVPDAGKSYALLAGGTAAPTAIAAGPRAGFGAFYPDGSVYLATSTAIDVARTYMTEAANAPVDATLYDAQTAQVVANHGIPPGALMPMFSPDGTLLVFNDNAIEAAHGLAIMHYDASTHTAADYKMLVKEPAGDTRPAWPFVLPDNGGVIFLRTNGQDFSGNGLGIMGGMGLGQTNASSGKPPIADLSIVDVATGKVTLLAQAMGYLTPDDAQNDTTYLPFGTDDLHHNFFPTLSPVAAGGYFWVFFDSYRHYGVNGLQRQLWGAAIDIHPDGSYTVDPSHPPFYLPGQEFGTGNHRAFAALDPCKKDGDKCTSGIDCCGGFCYFDKEPDEFGDAIGSCTPKMNKCSMRDERCTSDVDCCPPDPGMQANMCIAGFCAFIPVLN